jgi:hypothetical protein
MIHALFWRFDTFGLENMINGGLEQMPGFAVF